MRGYPTNHRGTLYQRFNEKYVPEPNSGCWLWIGACKPHGYGQISAPGGHKMLNATHVALEMDGRPLQPGMLACHHCDNPYCVNPKHLFAASHLGNMRDMRRKGRASQKLPNEKVVSAARDLCGPLHTQGENKYIAPKGEVQCRACRRRNRLKHAAQRECL